MELKQVILVRADLKLQKGKMSAQAAHASVDAVLKTLKHDKQLVQEWKREGMKKTVLRIADQKELFHYQRAAHEAGLITAVITDAGHTAVAPGTITCMAIGPDNEETIDKVTGHLKMI